MSGNARYVFKRRLQKFAEAHPVEIAFAIVSTVALVVVLFGRF